MGGSGNAGGTGPVGKERLLLPTADAAKAGAGVEAVEDVALSAGDAGTASALTSVDTELEGRDREEKGELWCWSLNPEGRAKTSSWDADAALNEANEFEGGGELKVEMTERHLSANAAA